VRLHAVSRDGSASVYIRHLGGLIAELLGQFRELHPAVDLQISEGRARDTIGRFARGGLTSLLSSVAPASGDCHSKPLWTEALVVALRERHPLAGAQSVRWSELAGENFVARRGGAGPQVHDHIVLRLAEHWSQPRIQRFDVERDTLMSMVAQAMASH